MKTKTDLLEKTKQRPSDPCPVCHGQECEQEVLDEIARTHGDSNKVAQSAASEVFADLRRIVDTYGEAVRPSERILSEAVVFVLKRLQTLYPNLPPDYLEQLATEVTRMIHTRKLCVE